MRLSWEAGWLAGWLAVLMSPLTVSISATASDKSPVFSCALPGNGGKRQLYI